MGKTKAKARKKDKSTQAVGEVLTLAEAAAFLRVAEEPLRADAAEGRLPAKFVGGEWRFGRSAMLGWLESPSRPLRANISSDETPEEQEAFLARLREIRKEWGTVGGDGESETP